jgi:hypothetical protein
MIISTNENNIWKNILKFYDVRLIPQYIEIYFILLTKWQIFSKSRQRVWIDSLLENDS